MSRSWTLAALAALSLFLMPLAALAHEYKIGDLVIHHPWTRATPPGAAVAGGYAEITNTGSTADKLLSASFEAANTAEIHEMSMQGDVMKMALLPGGLDIPAGSSVALKPGSSHMMFMGLSRQIKQGEKIKGTLVFEKAGTIAVDFAVEALGAKGDHADHAEPAKTQ
jgi:periplasmic copper chaperone A